LIFIIEVIFCITIVLFSLNWDKDVNGVRQINQTKKGYEMKVKSVGMVILWFFLLLLLHSCTTNIEPADETINPVREDTNLALVDLDSFNANTQTVELMELQWMVSNINIDDHSSNSYCFEYEYENCQKYGRMYAWNNAMEICPEGWRLPTKLEWETMIDSLETKSFSLQDSTGFAAQYGGVNHILQGVGFLGKEEITCWWSSTEQENNRAQSWNYYAYANNAYYLNYNGGPKSTGCYVRCIVENIAGTN